MNILKTMITVVLIIFCFSSVTVMAQEDALIHQYKFDGNLDDAVGDSNGVYVDGYGPLTFIDGHDGTPNGAIDFPAGDGLGYMIRVGYFSPSQEGTPNEMTVTFWGLWHGSTGSWQDIINKRDGWSPDQMVWGINQHSATGDVLSVRRNGMNCDSDQGMPEEQWTHVAIAMNNDDCWFYINGVQYYWGFFEYGTKWNAKIVMGSAANDPELWRPGDAYNGALDDVRFYSRVLTEEEILAIYQEATAIEEKPSTVPAKFELAQNFPNPFNPSTNITFILAKNSHTLIKVYNIFGQEVATLVDENLIAGPHTIQFNGSHLESGVYFYNIVAGDYQASKKMMLIK